MFSPPKARSWAVAGTVAARCAAGFWRAGRSSVWACAISVLAGSLAGPPVAAGPAINQFEIKDLQSSPGDFEFQSQNAFMSRQPHRRTAVAGGEFLTDENTMQRQREALELQLGITDWFRVRLGVEYEQEGYDQPASARDARAFASLKLSEVAVEGVVVFVKPKPEGVGLGLLIEYGSPTGSNEANELYLGPIIEAHTGPWSLIANLTFVKMLGGKADPGEDEHFMRDDKWDFAYFIQAKHTFDETWALALEAYGTIDRLGHTGHPSEAGLLFGDFNQHRLGPVLYWTTYPGRDSTGAARHKPQAHAGDDDGDKSDDMSVSLGLGLLAGLNGNTPDMTYKLSLEIGY